MAGYESLARRNESNFLPVNLLRDEDVIPYG